MVNLSTTASVLTSDDCEVSVEALPVATLIEALAASNELTNDTSASVVSDIASSVNLSAKDINPVLQSASCTNAPKVNPGNNLLLDKRISLKEHFDGSSLE